MAEDMTIGQIADLFEEKFGEFSSDYHARQLRHHVQLGIHAPYKRTGEGRTAAARFRPDEVTMIRLVGVLARIGLSNDLLAQASKARDNVAIVAGEEKLVGVRQVMKDVAAGKEWFFHFHIAATPEGERGYGEFTRSRDAVPPKLLADHVIGTVVLPCLQLLKPLALDD